MATNVVHNCVRCFKVKPRMIQQLMGQLPRDRVCPSRPFHTTGIDFCGPVYVHHKIRGKPPGKAYISVFVCFSTKPVHLELVNDLSSQAFLNALKRFVARRGLCATIYCDNGTNFVGGKRELQELATLIQSQQLQKEISRFCQEEQIQWKHIPPRAPHFGGLWEAAVKAAKHHLIRYTGLSHLTSEELQTVITQIKAILNSRPITPMSADPNDLEALTPGHFLIGAPITSLPEPNITDTNLSRLDKFRQLQNIHKLFWKRWSLEYLNQLQTKGKWKNKTENIKTGAMVLIKDVNLPPLKWQLGRVTSIIEGQDNLVRVVNVKTENGNLKRSIHHICPLPTEEIGSTEGPYQSSDNQQQKKPAAEQSESNNRRVLRSKKKSNLLSTALMVLLVACGSSTSRAQETSKNINITMFDNKMGLYFEGIGEVKTIHSNWNLIAYYNLTTYWQELNGLMMYNTTINQLCDRKEVKPTYCRAIAMEISNRIKTIDHNNILLHKINDHKARMVRSPFDFIGSISNSLFGILDQGYAKYIEGDIVRVNSNENHLLELIKRQTSISDNTINVLKRTTNDINAQFALMKSMLDTTDHFIRNEVKKEELERSFRSLTTYMLLILTNYENSQKNILDVLLDLHHSRVNPQLITPDQMQAQLSVVRTSISIPQLSVVRTSKSVAGSTLALPATDLLQLYKLIAVRARIVENAIIFKMEIPLPNNEYFQLFNVIPVPIILNNNSFMVKTSSRYLAITLLRDKYYQLTNEELRTCLQIVSSIYLCKPMLPIFNQQSNMSKCEIALLSHKREPLIECELQAIVTPEHWTRLANPNVWIFSIIKSTEHS